MMSDEAGRVDLDEDAPVNPDDSLVLLTKSDVLGHTEVRYETVPIPEWGPKTAVRVRGLNATERDAFEASLVIGKSGRQSTDLRNIRAKLVALACVTRDGDRMFTMKDVDNIGRVNAAVIDRIYDVASRLAGISEADVEVLAGNSDSAPGGDS